MALRTYSRSFCPFRVKTEKKTQDDSDIPTAATQEFAAEIAAKPKRSKSLGAAQSISWVAQTKVEPVATTQIFSKTYTAKKRKVSMDSLAMLTPAFAAERATTCEVVAETGASDIGADERERDEGIQSKSEQKRRCARIDAATLHDKLQYFARIDSEQLSLAQHSSKAVLIQHEIVRTQRTDVEVTSTKLWQVYQEYVVAISDIASPLPFEQFKRHQHKFIDELYDGIFDVR